MLSARVVFALVCAWAALALWTNPTLLPRALVSALPQKQFAEKYGEWAVVLGASRGLGKEWARALASRGLSVVVVGRDAKALSVVERELRDEFKSVKIESRACEMGDVDRVASVMRDLAQSRDVGFVVYNAAFTPVGLHLTHPHTMHRVTLNVNVNSVLAVVDEFVPRFATKKRGGLVLMSSADGEGCSPGVAHYAATKSWTTTFAEGLWYELKPRGVDVIGAIVGLTATESVAKVMDPKKLLELKATESQPEDVVDEVLRALGRQPTVITGPATKIVVWLRWLLPRRVGCSLMSHMLDMIRSEEELKKIAWETSGISQKQ
jgi:short-subunit dehydrogenase